MAPSQVKDDVRPTDEGWPMIQMRCNECGTSFQVPDDAQGSRCPKCEKAVRIVIAPPFPENVQAEARLILERLEETIDVAFETRLCLLWMMEREWLRSKGGHRVGVRIGRNHWGNDARCAACGTESKQRGTFFQLLDQWRKSMITAVICDDCLKSNLLGTVVDVQKHAMPTFGLD